MGENFKLDCKGLVCPMPVAKTKRLMNQMKSGDILEITGDFAEAAENIMRYIEKNEGETIESRFEGENYYLKIKKL
ncbi:MAG: sulfurtransferase TusA family protein [Promethearchaeota archaeon]|nr:MAG: sulfurtransferase TusA family protein [Candidatus Lokiarchaeota archaeon]